MWGAWSPLGQKLITRRCERRNGRRRLLPPGLHLDDLWGIMSSRTLPLATIRHAERCESQLRGPTASYTTPWDATPKAVGAHNVRVLVEYGAEPLRRTEAVACDEEVCACGHGNLGLTSGASDYERCLSIIDALWADPLPAEDERVWRTPEGFCARRSRSGRR